MKKFESVADFIDSQDKWKEELILLRDICLSTELVETVKWGIPTYTINKKNVAGIGAFKEHVAIWFFQGTFLKDEKKYLINAQEGTTKGLLQWRFKSIKEINPEEVKAYILEAIENEKAGKRIKVDRKKELILPDELKEALNKNPELQKAFESFTPFKKREFADHIREAKREATRIKRLEKCEQLILQGIGLHDKYR